MRKASVLHQIDHGRRASPLVMRESLKKPLLVARAENVEGTEAVGIRNNINNYHPVA